MGNSERIVPSGPFKGKKIELAPTAGVEMFRDLAGEFMEAIFEMAPGSYLITDESSLHDFEDVGDVDLPDMHERIRCVFAIDVTDIRSGNLVEIFARIHQRRMTDRDR